MVPRSVGQRSVSAAVAATLWLTLLGAVGPARAVTDGPACASNQDTVPGRHGPTDLLAHGTTRFKHAEIDGQDVGDGALTWNVHAEIIGPNTGPNDGDLTGFLTLSVDWDAPDRPTTTFASDCVVRIQTSVGFLDFAHYGGSVSNYPPSTASRAEGTAGSAGGRIMLERVSAGRANVDVEIIACCFSTLDISRNNAVARGSKTGNAFRGITG